MTSIIPEAEGRVLIGHQRRVSAYSVCPSIHTYDQLENALGIFTGEQKYYSGKNDRIGIRPGILDL